MNHTEGNKETIWDLMILGAMFIFGSYALFLRGFRGIPTITFLFAFQIVGAVSFGLLHLKDIRLPARREFMLLAALAFVAVGNDFAYFQAFRWTTVANAAVAHQMVSVALLFLAPLLLGEKTKQSEWMALAFALAGIVLVYQAGLEFGGAKDVLGITLGLFSAVFLAFLIILYRKLKESGLSLVMVNSWRYLLSTVLLLPLMAPMGGFAVGAKDIAPLAAFGFLFAFAASGIHTFAISRARSLHSSIIGKSEPVIAAVYASIFLKEIPSLTAVVGGTLIIGASLWLALRGET